jgi:hypothetical protein
VDRLQKVSGRRSLPRSRVNLNLMLTIS